MHYGMKPSGADPIRYLNSIMPSRVMQYRIVWLVHDDSVAYKSILIKVKLSQNIECLRIQTVHGEIREVFHYTWRAIQIRGIFVATVFSRMEWRSQLHLGTSDLPIHGNYMLKIFYE